jgi:hypothetical protein
VTREHTPRPGATWQQQPTTREVAVPDDSWDGPIVVRFWGLNEPTPTRPNRRARRDAARAARKASR